MRTEEAGVMRFVGLYGTLERKKVEADDWVCDGGGSFADACDCGFGGSDGGKYWTGAGTGGGGMSNAVDGL